MKFAALSLLAVASFASAQESDLTKCVKAKCGGNMNDLNCVAMCAGNPNPNPDMIAQTNQCYNNCIKQYADAGARGQCQQQCDKSVYNPSGMNVSLGHRVPVGNSGESINSGSFVPVSSQFTPSVSASDNSDSADTSAATVSASEESGSEESASPSASEESVADDSSASPASQESGSDDSASAESGSDSEESGSASDDSDDSASDSDEGSDDKSESGSESEESSSSSSGAASLFGASAAILAGVVAALF